MTKFLKKKMPKKKKASNKKVKKRAHKRVSSFSVKKRRGRDLYDVKFPEGYKEQSVLENYIQNLKMKFSEFPDQQVKITSIAKKRKQKASMSFIYELEEGTSKENGDNMKYMMLDMIADIFKKKTERDKTKSWQRIQPIKNYINHIIIDFETND